MAGHIYVFILLLKHFVLRKCYVKDPLFIYYLLQVNAGEKEQQQNNALYHWDSLFKTDNYIWSILIRLFCICDVLVCTVPNEECV